MEIRQLQEDQSSLDIDLTEEIYSFLKVPITHFLNKQMPFTMHLGHGLASLDIKD